MVLAGFGDEVFTASDWSSECISVSKRVNNAMRKSNMFGERRFYDDKAITFQPFDR